MMKCLGNFNLIYDSKLNAVIPEDYYNVVRDSGAESLFQELNTLINGVEKLDDGEIDFLKGIVTILSSVVNVIDVVLQGILTVVLDEILIVCSSSVGGGALVSLGILGIIDNLSSVPFIIAVIVAVAGGFVQFKSLKKTANTSSVNLINVKE